MLKWTVFVCYIFSFISVDSMLTPKEIYGSEISCNYEKVLPNDIITFCNSIVSHDTLKAAKEINQIMDKYKCGCTIIGYSYYEPKKDVDTLNKLFINFLDSKVSEIKQGILNKNYDSGFKEDDYLKEIVFGCAYWDWGSSGNMYPEEEHKFNESLKMHSMIKSKKNKRLDKKVILKPKKTSSGKAIPYKRLRNIAIDVE